MGRPHHLVEEQLFDCYAAERVGEPLDPRSAEHLADCGECGDHYTELSRFMDSLRTEADAETEALFPSDRQDAQRLSIMLRIEHLGHAARVIAFPGRLVTQQMGKSIRLRVSPWTATAAAACLFVGVAVGMFYDARNHRPPFSASRVVPNPTAPQATAGDVSVAEASVPLEQGALGILAGNPEPVVFSGADLAREEYAHLNVRRTLHSLAYLPLKAKDDLIGTLEILSFDGEISLETLAALQSVADVGGSALAERGQQVIEVARFQVHAQRAADGAGEFDAGVREIDGAAAQVQRSVQRLKIT
jgi:predicted anti-sigma-YlaC factor YlaD